jgi:hypothetical protein
MSRIPTALNLGRKVKTNGSTSSSASSGAAPSGASSSGSSSGSGGASDEFSKDFAALSQMTVDKGITLRPADYAKFGQMLVSFLENYDSPGSTVSTVDEHQQRSRKLQTLVAQMIADSMSVNRDGRYVCFVAYLYDRGLLYYRLTLTLLCWCTVLTTR